MRYEVNKSLIGAPPHGQGAAEARSNVHTATSNVSTAAVAIVSPATSATAPRTGADHAQIVTMVANQDVRIRFGVSDVGAATTSDFLIPKNVIVSWLCGDADTHFRVIRDSADGALEWYVESAGD